MSTHLPNHSASVPVLGLGLLQAAGERSGVHKAVGCILGSRGLADDELVEVEAVLRDLEERRAREGCAGLVDQAVTVEVETLVVELDVVLENSGRSYQHSTRRRSEHTDETPKVGDLRSRSTGQHSC